MYDSAYTYICMSTIMAGGIPAVQHYYIHVYLVDNLPGGDNLYYAPTHAYTCMHVICCYGDVHVHVQVHVTLAPHYCMARVLYRGVSSGGLKGLEHPPKVWHNCQLSSCVTTIVTNKQQLIAKTNNKLTELALNNSFSQLLGLKQPSLSFKNALMRGVSTFLGRG